MNKDHYVVIMAGGIGSRFWPYSRQTRPKQFLDILNTGRSLIQMTYDRFLKLAPAENIYVVTNEEYGPLVKEHLPDMTDDQILLEPSRKNTAPCIAYASYKIVKKNANAVITVSPADHVIFDTDKFDNVILTAIENSDDKKLITIGLKPHRPETGYGYIQYLESDGAINKVKTFTEKPELELAKTFLESGDFVWNSGIFVWRAKAIINGFEQCLPSMAEDFQEISDQLSTENEISAIGTAYSRCTNISIDYGVMEKSSDVYVVLGDFGWSDLGSWESLHEHSEKDENNNAIDANSLVYDTTNSLIKMSKDKLVVVQGLDDYLVVEDDNILLICKKSEEKKFRTYVADTKEKKGKEFL